MNTEDLDLRTAIVDFLSYTKNRKGRSDTTIDTYTHILKGFLKVVGNIPVSELTIHVVETYARELDKHHYKSKTFRNKMVPVRCLVAYLYKFDYCNLKPEAIDLPQGESAEAIFLDEKESRRLIKIIKNPRDKAIVLVMITSGLRVGELSNLRVDDVYDRSIVVRKGKGNKPRITFINRKAREALDEHVKINKVKKGYLFPNPNGTPLSRAIIGRKISTYALLAGIDKHVSPHTLRHTFATTMLKRGANIETTQKLMGHVNIRTTRIYLHFTNDDLRRNYNKVMA